MYNTSIRSHDTSARRYHHSCFTDKKKNEAQRGHVTFPGHTASKCLVWWPDLFFHDFSLHSTLALAAHSLSNTLGILSINVPGLESRIYTSCSLKTASYPLSASFDPFILWLFFDLTWKSSCGPLNSPNTPPSLAYTPFLIQLWVHGLSFSSYLAINLNFIAYLPCKPLNTSNCLLSAHQSSQGQQKEEGY